MNRFKRLAIVVACLFIVFAIISVALIHTDTDTPKATTTATVIKEADAAVMKTELPTEPTEPEPTEPTEPEPTEVTEPESTEPTVDESIIYEDYEYTLELLACVIYQEAGGDAVCDDCRYRVADVVLNRVADPRFPDNIYDVLTARSQYGSFHWTGVVWPDRARYNCELHAVERAYDVAADILNGNHSELYNQGYVWQAEFVQGSDVIYCCGHYFCR